MEEEFDPYRVLGLPVGADERAIRRRYRDLVRKHHPDVSADSQKAHQRFVRIQQAYRLLMNPAERARWEQRAGIDMVREPQVTVRRPGTRFDHLLADGRRFLRERRLRQARDAVAAAIELNPFSPEAYQLLGDIYAAGGNVEMAREMYQEARLLGARPPGKVRPTPSSGSSPITPEPAKPQVRVPVLSVGLVGAVVCLLGMSLTDFSTAPLMFAALGMSGAFLLSAAGVASGLVEPIDELLALAEVREPSRGAAPGGLYLILLSVISPYLGVAYCAIVFVLTESRSHGIIKIYIVTFAVSLGGWLATSGEGPGFALVAPSIAFIASLAGWVAGSFAAPGEWWRR